MDTKIKDFQSLSNEEFGKLYDSSNDVEKAEIIRLVKKDANEFILEAKAFIRETTIKMKLGEMLEIIPLAYIARIYFGKSKQWLYQRVNGYMINGKRAKFTEQQLQIFNGALKDIGHKVGSIELV
jgi:hypothetical protein